MFKENIKSVNMSIQPGVFSSTKISLLVEFWSLSSRNEILGSFELKSRGRGLGFCEKKL